MLRFIFRPLALSYGLMLFTFTTLASNNLGPKLPKKYLSLPFVAQAQSWSCGAAAMLSVLTYWQVYDGNESSLYGELSTSSDQGTDPVNMLNYAQKLGLKAELKTEQTLEDLEKALAQGMTVIVDYQAWGSDETNPIDYSQRWEDGHYSVLVAMNSTHLFLMDPSLIGRYGYLTKEDFLQRWHDYEIRNNQRVDNWRLALYIQGTNSLRPTPSRIE